MSSISSARRNDLREHGLYFGFLILSFTFSFFFLKRPKVRSMSGSPTTNTSRNTRRRLRERISVLMVIMLRGLEPGRVS